MRKVGANGECFIYLFVQLPITEYPSAPPPDIIGKQLSVLKYVFPLYQFNLLTIVDSN